MSDDYPDFKALPPPPRPKASEFDVIARRMRRERMDKLWRLAWRVSLASLTMIMLYGIYRFVNGR